jgi:HSP20 family protein
MSRRISLIRPSQVIDAFIDDFLRNTPFSGVTQSSMNDAVNMDMYETENAVVVEVALPGYKTGDVKISVEDNVLTVEGQRKVETENKKYHMKEIYSESFMRSVTIPVKIDSENAEATLKDGVMTITLPKAKEAKAKSIEIKTA